MALADYFSVADGESVAGKNAVLAAGATISGTLTGAGGAALSASYVSAYTTYGYVASATTDGLGHYSMVGLAPGSYTLEFSPGMGMNYSGQWWNNKPTQLSADYFTVGNGATVVGKDAMLAAGATISGTVTALPSTNIAGVFVSAHTTGGFVAGNVTDSSGHYSIVGLPTDNYTLEFYPLYDGSLNYLSQWWNNKSSQAAADYFPVSGGATVTGKDAVLTVGATISGTVTDASNAPIAGANVTAHMAVGSVSGVFSAQTDGSGHYSLVGLAAGSYTVAFGSPHGSNFAGQWWNNKPTQVLADYFVVSDGATLTGKDAVLAAGATVSGTVTGTSSGGLANVQVDVWTTSGFVGGANSDGSGNYSVQGLPAGTYTLQFSLQFSPNNGMNYVNQWWNNQPSQALADYFPVSAGATVLGKNAILAAGATISGHVSWPGNVNAGGFLVDSKDSAGNWTGGSYTGADGNYTIVGLPAGQFTLYFRPDNGKSGQWWSNKTSFASATFFPVTSAAIVTGKDVTLVPESTISGMVRDPAGAALANISTATSTTYPVARIYDATASGATADSLVATAFTKGGFTVPGLGVGTYKVQFAMEATYTGLDPSTDFVPQWYSGAYSFGSASVLTVTSAGQSLTGVDGVLYNPRFADVADPSGSFFSYVEWMASQGISLGTSQPTGKPLYKPVDAVSRQAMALFLYRLSGETFVPPTDSMFADVGSGSSFYTAVEWMAARGISTGTIQPSGKPLFKPTDPVSRQAMALFLARYDHINVSVLPAVQSFSDVATSSTFAAAIAWMKTVGISTGTAQPTGLPLFKPVDPVSRQAMAAFLYRLAHLPT